VFFPVLYLSGLFILVSNLLGVLPYSFTITASAAVTFFFYINFFFWINLAGYRQHKDALFQILLPPGVPIQMVPFLVLVEGVSYAARLFSLSVRLFANMMSGHGLLKILGSFMYPIILSSSVQFNFMLFPPMVLVFAVAFLELAVAFLQAYVFVVLVCIYLNDVICMH